VGGVISDFEMSQEILRQFLRRVGSAVSFASFGTAVVGVPSNLTEVERKSVEDAVVGAGVFRSFVIDEPLAAALGARLPITEPTANMIVDIGGGTTEVAILSMAGTVTSKSLKVAGDKLNDDIVRFLRDEFRLAIGEATAEDIKLAVGSAVPLESKLEVSVRGRDLASGLPKEVQVKDSQIRSAISKSLHTIVEAVREVLEVSPPELAGDILRCGIHLSGGGSLLRGIDMLISKELSVSVTIVDDPLTCVARGTGVAVEQLGRYLPLLENPVQPKAIRL
ncbi:MAG: rod shape-determining protein, partial [Candidatus Colwellbacteria bacterium]|nr:rod shape-determining protein [Candidatus Colwellbacteria bacterium]